MECYSEEVDSRSCGERKKQKKRAEEGGSRGGGGKGGDGSSIEVVKRPRGRPPGSKNKPRPPVVITREFVDPSPAMRPHVLEIPAGRDVAAALAAFSRRRSLGICVLAAVGTVSSVTLRQPHVPADESAAAAAVTFRGRFEILSISATFFPPSLPVAAGGGFSVSLAGPQGRMIGGMVAGPLVAAGTVVVVAAAFGEPSFHRLPVEDQAGSASASLSGGGGAAGGDEAAAQPHQDGDDYNDHDEEAQHHYHHHHYDHDHDHDHGSSDGIPIYSGHFPPHVWNPTVRSPNPPPPPPY